MSSCVCKPYPGYVIGMGSSGSVVSNIQYYLNAIKTSLPTIPAVTVDGVFGSATERSVAAFQRAVGLAADGKVGAATGFAFCRKLCIESVHPVAKPWPGSVYRQGSSGSPVRDIQLYLSNIAEKFPNVQREQVDGVFGTTTDYSVRIFQQEFGLNVDGAVGRDTWNKLVEIYNTL